MADNTKTYLKTSLDRQIESLGVIATIVQATTLSGCNKVESDIVATHLIQGLQSGVLEGDNFNVVSEYAPRLVQAIADGLGVNRNILRKMARAGELMTDVVVQAIQSQFEVVNNEFKELPVSLGGTRPRQPISMGGASVAALCLGLAIILLSIVAYNPTKDKPSPDIEILTTNHSKVINMNLIIAKHRDKRYDAVLSKNNSGRASRDTLAFYVANARIDSQIYSKYLDTPLKAHKSAPRKQSLIQASLLPNDYEGKTSLNKIAVRRISGAVAIVAESDSSHPIFAYSVIPTQKTIGAIHHG